MTVITVQSIHPPSGGGRRTLITTTDGQRLGCWPETAGIFKVGGSYDVAIEESDHEGRTYRNIKKATPAVAPAAPATGGAAGAFRTPEQMFVSEVLTAYIANGRCEPQNLAGTIRYIRKAWAETFGNAPITGYREAAE